MHGAEEAVEPVEAETGAPVDRGFDEREDDRGGQPEEDRVDQQATKAQPWGRIRDSGQGVTLLDRDHREPDERGGSGRPEAEDYDRHDDEPGPPGGLLKLQRDHGGLWNERVHEHSRGQHHERREGRPERQSTDAAGPGHVRTRSVNGAVSTLPSAFVCRNSRQTPASGTSTPTVSFPGVVERPVTRAAPRTLVHPVASGLQT